MPSSERPVGSGFGDPREVYSSYPTGTQQSACPPCSQATTLGDDQHIPLNLSKSSSDLLGNSTGLTAQFVGATAKVKLPSLFLFAGVLSGRGYRHRRLAVREAWSNKAQVPGVSIAKFILSADERTPQVTKELDQHGDIIFIDHKTNYKSILFKTYFVLEYAVTKYNVKFVLKTDDDAFINVEPLISQLHLLCMTEDCTNERIYMGRMAKESEVLLQPGHKWNNIVFHNHTGLRTYPTYAMGGGYVLSGDVANMLVTVNLNMKLKFTPIEDATVGFWLMSMDLRHIDHRRFHTWAAPCCFKPPQRRDGQRPATRFLLQEDIEDSLCSEDPWLVLHKIDSPTKMRFVGNKVAQCDPANFTTSKIAASLAHYIGPEGPLDAETVEKELQQAALAAVAAQIKEAAKHEPAANVKKHKLPSDFPAAAGQHLDGEAVEDKSVHDDKSAAQKLSEQLIEQRKLGEGDTDVDAGVVLAQQVSDAGQVGQADDLTALQQASQLAGEAQAAASQGQQQQEHQAGVKLTALQQDQQAQTLQLQQQPHEQQAAAELAVQQEQQQHAQQEEQQAQQQQAQPHQMEQQAASDLTALQQEQQAQMLQLQQQSHQQQAAAELAVQQEQQAQQQQPEQQVASDLTALQQEQQAQQLQLEQQQRAKQVGADLSAQQREQQTQQQEQPAELQDAVTQDSLVQQQQASQAQQAQTMQV